MLTFLKTKLPATGVFLLAVFFSQAQNFKFSSYGFPASDELAMMSCSFDKDANAIILLHEAFSDYDDQYQLVSYHHVRMKIFNEKAVDMANIKIPYYRKDDFEYISWVEGFTLNIAANGDQVKTKLDKKSIFDQKKTAFRGEVSFAFPAVKPGSIVEYSYRSVMKHYGGLDEWIFQETIPVLASKYKLTILPNAEFAYSVQKRDDMPVTIKPNNSTGTIYFEMQNIPGLDKEPYMDAREDYLQKIIFQLSGYNFRGARNDKYMQSWDAVIKELMNDDRFGQQLTKNIPGLSETLKQVENLTPEEKIKFIYNHVRQQMSWNHGTSKYSESVKAAWQKKEGSNGDINLVLVNLLKEAGLEAYPVLVSERWHGKVNTTYPFLDQFNTVFAYVQAGDRTYFLDATDKYASPELIPYDVLNTTALIVNKKNGGLVTITNDRLQYNDHIQTRLELSKSGVITGETTVTSTDYAMLQRKMDYAEDKESFLKDYFHKNTERLKLIDFSMPEVANDSSTLVQKASFETKHNSDGNFYYLPLDLFSTFTENPFLAEERFSNVNFGYKRNIVVQTMANYPEDFVVDELPKPFRMTNPEKDIVVSRVVENDKANRLINSRITIEFKSGLYAVDTYPVLKEIYKKLHSMLKEPVVLKKK